jgi:DNA-directed RNA polymerase specialized sigma24 family protein
MRGIMDQLERLCHDESIREILGELSLAQALTVLMMLEGYSQVEVAEFMGTSRQAVQQRMSKARENLAKADPRFQAMATDPDRQIKHGYRGRGFRDRAND